MTFPSAYPRRRYAVVDGSRDWRDCHKMLVAQNLHPCITHIVVMMRPPVLLGKLGPSARQLVQVEREE
jgi:hypothetical protein